MNTQSNGLSLGIQDLEALEAPKNGRGAYIAGVIVGVALGIAVAVLT